MWRRIVVRGKAQEHRNVSVTSHRGPTSRLVKVRAAAQKKNMIHPSTPQPRRPSAQKPYFCVEARMFFLFSAILASSSSRCENAVDSRLVSW